MLVLSRRRGEELVIVTETGEEIIIVAVETTGGQVRLGIHAPQSMKIWRREIYKAAQGEKNHVSTEHPA